MNNILELANQYREDVKRRAVAHEVSSEWHRHVGARLGVAATGLTAVVGTSIFAAVAKQLQEGKPDLSKFGPWSWLIFFAIGLVVVLSPVFTNVQAYLRHPEQAATHKTSYVRYCRLEQRLDIFCLRYGGGNSASMDRMQALQELDEISKEIEKVADSSITLTKHAYDRADERLSGKKLKPWWKFWQERPPQKTST